MPPEAHCRVINTNALTFKITKTDFAAAKKFNVISNILRCNEFCGHWRFGQLLVVTGPSNGTRYNTGQGNAWRHVQRPDYFANRTRTLH